MGGNLVGNVGGNVNGSVASVASAVDINSNQDLTDTLSNITSVKGTVEALPSAAQNRVEMDTNSTTLAAINGTVNHVDYGNAKLVRSTTPANTLDVDADGNVTTANPGSGATAAQVRQEIDANSTKLKQIYNWQIVHNR